MPTAYCGDRRLAQRRRGGLTVRRDHAKLAKLNLLEAWMDATPAVVAALGLSIKV
jgi:hypothetical protein